MFGPSGSWAESLRIVVLAEPPGHSVEDSWKTPGSPTEPSNVSQTTTPRADPTNDTSTSGSTLPAIWQASEVAHLVTKRQSLCKATRDGGGQLSVAVVQALYQQLEISVSKPRQASPSGDEYDDRFIPTTERPVTQDYGLDRLLGDLSRLGVGNQGRRRTGLIRMTRWLAADRTPVIDPHYSAAKRMVELHASRGPPPSSTLSVPPHFINDTALIAMH
ncbi:hypothetical protein QBC34DRAFT_470913 [Podospora aff. communis PSN243]|uniref:Uncharacterized protein n=1 Tax=Podospora aff. communis PSN243 TaxID=3040156 RepID=A0AAV9GDJ7_9PEZI|nr:hypothetical protein QBC34DRAFT_470913 [Podospora aff. communis PSN243]